MYSLRSSAPAGPDDFECSALNSRGVGSKVSISGLPRWRGNLPRSSSRVIEGFYPQTEIRSNERGGTRLWFETASEQRALNRRDRSLIDWWSSKLGFLVPLYHRHPVLAFQFAERRKIGCLLLFRQA